LNRANIASKQNWVERYDSEVQAATAIRPFEGSQQCGPSDSSVLSLQIHGGSSGSGVALAHGMSTKLMSCDPALAAAWALDEAIRSLVCSGADPDKIAILDNFCWPDPLGADGQLKLGALVRACQGLAQAAMAMGTPLISGKDSMKNDYRGPARDGSSQHYWVDPTLLITAVGHTPLKARTCMGFKSAGDEIFVLFADTQSHLQASEWAATFNHQLKLTTPSAPATERLQDFRRLHQLMLQGLIASAHDVSEGGLWCALAESAFASGYGINLQWPKDWSEESMIQAFGEWSGAVVISVSPQSSKQVQQSFSPKRLKKIATVSDCHQWNLHMPDGNKYSTSMQDLKQAWLRSAWP
jgi:phosphoribosylformylglycinamidine synthase